MADISQYLANIMSAVYGEDVRGSIHDAIDIINQVSEVVLTAGTAITGPTSSSTGFFEDSFYLNTNTNDLWKCVGTDAWTLVGNFEGNGIVSITKTSTSGLVDTYTVTYTKGSPTYFAVTNGKDGNKWYNGNSIYGKAVLPTVYASSGITYANSDDFYFNTTECAIYHCVTEGDPTVATWSYDFTITGGGHTIVDSSGTDEPQRGKLQFDGVNVDDDPVNDKTIVHGNIKVCQTEAAWLDLLENHPDQVNDPNVQWFLPWMSSERFATDRAPVGTVISITSQKSGDFTGATTPTGVYPPNSDYLVCDGVVKNITAYPQLANYFESAYGSKNYFGGDGTTTFALPDFSADFPDNGILCIKAQISSTIITEADVDETGISSATDKVPSCARVAGIEGLFNNASLITTGLTTSKGSIQYGGYCKIGKLVIVNIRFANSEVINNNETIIDGLPTNYSGSNYVALAVNLPYVSAYIAGGTKVNVMATDGASPISIPSGQTLMISGIYIAN